MNRALCTALAAAAALLTGACMNSPQPTDAPAASNDRFDLVVTRGFDAPPADVWHAWTDGEHVKLWWCPTGFSCPVAKMDVRLGGSSLVCMRAPAQFGGGDMYSTWTYTTLEPMRRIEYTFRFSDASGKPLDPSTLRLPPGMPAETRHVVTLREAPGGKTVMTMSESAYPSMELIELSRQGLEQCLDKMAASFAPR